MRVQIPQVTVNDMVCTEAEVSVAVSNSVAIRAVPVDASGELHEDAPISVVGVLEEFPDFSAGLKNLLETLFSEVI